MEGVISTGSKRKLVQLHGKQSINDVTQRNLSSIQFPANLGLRTDSADSI